jgi:hypothetical protein
MQFKVIDRGSTVKGGDLGQITTEHGHSIFEAKDYFNHPPGFENPVVLFNDTATGEQITLNLKRTATGFSSGTVRQGIKYGCNLNRIKNRPGRYGITAWYEALQEQAAPTV